MTNEENAPKRSDFIREQVREDLESGNIQKVITRFPPEPNGYLHLGHLKAIAINFGIAEEFQGETNLRFDDTNPATEKQEYIDAIREDIAWLGYQWARERYASDYFEQLYEYAIDLIKKGKAYVCDLTADEIREQRGTLTEPGVNSPHRDRSVEENLDLFERMRKGEFPDGTRTLRAKIDMASGNMNMRDPVMYRILHARHPRTGDAWCIYPMYDWAHGQSDSIENVTHSLCSIEFSSHRALYDWFIEQLGIFPSKQYEFARLNLTYTALSKRRLLPMVEEGIVNGWDDPRMPTLRGMRRRGFPPEALKAFCQQIGVAKTDSTVDYALLEHFVRDHLNTHAPRYMGVLKPLKVVITNYPEGQVEQFEAVNNPEHPEEGTRTIEFSREIYIEQDDFMEDPPRKFYRLAPGREVRLRYAYFVTCTDVIKDHAGNITELRCTYDPETKGGDAPDGRRPKVTMHWASAHNAVDAEVRLYKHLFTNEDPNELPESGDWKDNIDQDSLEALTDCKLEPALAGLPEGERVQFERLGYFSVDPDSSTKDKPVFNRIVTLRDEWARVLKQKKNQQKQKAQKKKKKTSE
ncbi:MAG: glutamine--tRNA ligase/YqeY domain fusion protein [Candidatus Sumerlaeota bacterium]